MAKLKHVQLKVGKGMEYGLKYYTREHEFWDELRDSEYNFQQQQFKEHQESPILLKQISERHGIP